MAPGADSEQRNEEDNTPQQYGKAPCFGSIFGKEIEEALNKL
jgi:hypothetical protein